MTKRNNNTMYANIKETLLNQIHEGVYKVGAQLPTEAELCDVFQASRTTIRQALNELEHQGIVERIQGRGTFVKRKEIHLVQTRSFSEDVLHNGMVPRNRLLDATVVPAAKPMDELLKVPLQSPVNALARVRYADEVPLLFEKTYIPWHVAPGLANDYKEDSGSLYAFLEARYQVKIVRSVEQLKPVLADKEAAKHLRVSEGALCLQVKTLAYGEEGKPLEVSFGIFRGDFQSYTIERYY